MSDDKLNFLDAEAPVAPTPEPAPQAPEPEAKAEAAPQAEPEPQGDGRPRDPETGRFIPIAALLDERDKKKSAEKRADESDARIRELEALLQQYQQPQQHEAQEHQEPQVDKAWDVHLNISEELARDKYGDEIVDAAQAAFKEAMSRDYSLYASLQQQRNPYKFVVEWHKTNQRLLEFSKDPDAYEAALEQRFLQKLQGQGVQPVQSSQQPPPSVVGRPAAAKAGSVPVGPGNAFDNLFRG